MPIPMKTLPKMARFPLRAEDCKLRVARGGSWDNTPVLARSAYRNGSSAGERDSGLGFRAGRTLKP